MRQAFKPGDVLHPLPGIFSWDNEGLGTFVVKGHHEDGTLHGYWRDAGGGYDGSGEHHKPHHFREYEEYIINRVLVKYQ